jgi:hypothetical protein
MRRFLESVWSGLQQRDSRQATTRQRRVALAIESLEERSLLSANHLLSSTMSVLTPAASGLYSNPVAEVSQATMANAPNITPVSIRVITQNGKQDVLANGRSVGVFDQVTNITISPNGRRYAFVGINESAGVSSYNVVVDGVNRATFNDGINALQFSSDSNHYAFEGRQSLGGNTFRYEVIVDGQIRGNYNAGISFFQFSPNGQHYAIVGINSQGAGQFVYTATVDTTTAGTFSKGIAGFRFSADSQHYAFEGLSSAGASVVKDGRVVATFNTLLVLGFEANDQLFMEGLVNGVQVTRLI